MIFRQLYDSVSGTYSYLLASRQGGEALILDPVLEKVDRYLQLVRELDLKLVKALDTHVHADHLSAAPYIQKALGGKIGIGDRIMVVQDVFGKIFNEGTEFQRDGSQFDALFKDGDVYQVGNLNAFAMYTPGHTPG